MAFRRRRGRRKGSSTPLPIARSPDSSKADTLKAAATSYFLKGGYSCFLELGLTSWGKLRADMLAVNLRQRIVICETKSGPADYKADRKWRQYLDYCNKMYFVMCPDTFRKLKPTLKVDLKGTGVGVMVLNPDTGFLDVKKTAKDRDMEPETTLSLITRMAWRGGISKRTNRRTRYYLPTETPRDEDQEDSSRKAQRLRSAHARSSNRRKL